MLPARRRPGRTRRTRDDQRTGPRRAARGSPGRRQRAASRSRVSGEADGQAGTAATSNRGPGSPGIRPPPATPWPHLAASDTYSDARPLTSANVAMSTWCQRFSEATHRFRGSFRRVATRSAVTALGALGLVFVDGGGQRGVVVDGWRDRVVVSRGRDPYCVPVPA